MYFIEKLIQLIKDKRSIVCMGLDPRMQEPGQIPEFLSKQLKDPNKIILEFNKSLIENVYDLIPVIKPQIAFYERYDAFDALKKTINYAHKKDLLVILDSKRNDIGPTSEAYAYSTFKIFNADACTLNAYFGIDSIKPFLEYQDKGTFIIVKSSNPSSEEFQNLFSAELSKIPNTETEYKVNSIVLERNYIQMAKLVYKWGLSLRKFSTFNNLGVVVGATYPNELKKVREIVKNSYILIPGYGAQGAQVKDIIYGFNERGLGAIVNSSRNIIYAYHIQKKPPEKFAEAAREEVLDMNSKINKEIRIKE